MVINAKGAIMKTVRILKCLVVLTGIYLLLGCTSMYDITSEPSGAQIYLSGQMVGITPDRVTFPVGQSKTVTLKKEGYETVSRFLPIREEQYARRTSP